MSFDVVTYILSKKYADKIISMLPRGFIYKGSVSYYKNLPSTAEIGYVYTVVYKGESGTEPWGAEFVCSAVTEGVPTWLQLGADYEEEIRKLEERIAQTYLPLTAGDTKPLTGNLHINTTTVPQLSIANGTESNGKFSVRTVDSGTVLASTKGTLIIRPNGEDKSTNTNCSIKLSHNDSAITPEVNNKTSLGTESYQWANIYSTDIYQNGTKVATTTELATESSARIGADTQLQTNINAKQDILVSGTNIKTINNDSILGSGNLDVTALIGRDFVTQNTVGGITAGTTISASEKLADLIYRILGEGTPVHEYKVFYFEGAEKPTAITSAWTTSTVTEKIKQTGLTYTIVGGIKGYLGVAINKALGQLLNIHQNDFTLSVLSDFTRTEVSYQGEVYYMYVADELAILDAGDKFKYRWA